MCPFSHACGATGPVSLDVVGPWSGRHAVDGPAVRIGRHPGSDIVLDHPEVGRRHTYLQVIAGRLFRLDLGSRPDASSMGWVDPAKPFAVGPFLIRAQLGDGPLPDSPTARDDLPSALSAAYANRCAAYPAVTLAIDDSRGAVSTYPVTRVLTLIGRAPACKIRLGARGASLYYGALLRTPVGPWFIDLFSSAGVVVNDRRVALARLHPGDRIHVDRYLMTVRSVVPDEADQDRPAAASVTLPSPLPTKPRTVATPGIEDWLGPPSGYLEPTTDELQPLLRELAHMHERTCEQFREVILVLTQLFGSMQADQMRAVREQIEEIRTLAGTIQNLRTSPMGAGPGSVAIPAPPDPANTRDVGRNGVGGPETIRNRPDPRAIDALIGERLAQYEVEREQRWNKLLRTLTGR